MNFNLFLTIILIIFSVSIFIVNNQHFQFTKMHATKAAVISQYIEPRSLIVGNYEDFIYVGPHLTKEFAQAGYLDIQQFKLEEASSKYSRILILEIGSDTQSDRPGAEMLKFIAENREKLKLLINESRIKIHEYQI